MERVSQSIKAQSALKKMVGLGEDRASVLSTMLQAVLYITNRFMK